MSEMQFDAPPSAKRRPVAADAAPVAARLPATGERDAECALLGLGVAVPTDSLDQAQAADFAAARCTRRARQRDWLARIYRQSGINRRASVLLDGDGLAGLEGFYPANDHHGPSTGARMQRYAAAAPPLAARACRAAMADAAMACGAITHIVVVSCTGFMSPGLDAQLIESLGLSPDIGRLNVGFMGCHGALNGMRAARALATSQPGARVLMCCVELCSLHFQYGWDTQNVVANALFADGAGAVVFGDAPSGDGWHLTDTASRIAPHTEGAMSWRIGDHGFEMTLGRDVPRLIRATAHDWVETWLAGHNLGIRDIAHWAIHPGGPKIIDTVIESLALSDAAATASRSILAQHGNMSSPTVLFILEQLRQQGAAGPCVALGFGPGLALEAALLV